MASADVVPSGAMSENNTRLIVFPTIIFFLASPLFVGTRLWARGRGGTSQLGVDDYTIVAALAFAVMTGVLELFSVGHGLGRHGISLGASDRAEALKYFYIVQSTYKFCIALVKTSILLLYIRIFRTIDWFRRACIFMIALVLMYCVAAVAASIFQCKPISRAFDKSIDGTCIDMGKSWSANAGFSITTDIIILLLPMPLVHELQVPRAQKTALVFVFAVGLFVVITSCLRFTTLNTQAKTDDPTYDIHSNMWTIIEMNVAIICACLPQIRPLIVKLFPKLVPGFDSSKKQTTGHRTSLHPQNFHHIGSDDARWGMSEESDAYGMSVMVHGGSNPDQYKGPDKAIHVITVRSQRTAEKDDGTCSRERSSSSDHV